MEPPGTAPGSDPLITGAFIAIVREGQKVPRRLQAPPQGLRQWRLSAALCKVCTASARRTVKSVMVCLGMLCAELARSDRVRDVYGLLFFSASRRV